MKANITNSVSMTVAITKNLNANLTVPSIFSCVIAVGKYDIKLKNRNMSYGCTNGPVIILHTNGNVNRTRKTKFEITLNFIDDKAGYIDE